MNGQIENVLKIKLLKFFDENNNIQIPFYQRNYVWDFKNDVQKLIDDIINFNGEYYLGSILIKNFVNQKIIIDGQQRITTFLLLLTSLLNNNKVDNEYRNEIKQILSKIKYKSFNYENQNTVENILNNNENINKTNCSKVYIELTKFFSHWNIEKFYDFIKNLKNVVFSVTYISSSTDEHILFSRINSTGQKLTGFDLFKNYLFQYFVNESIEILENKLNNVNKLVENKNSKEQNKMLRYYIAFETNKLVNINSEKLYYEYCEFFKNFDANSDYEKANSLYDRFLKFGIFYNYFIENKFKNDLEITKRMWIIENNIDTFIPLLVNLLKHFSIIKNQKIEFENKQKYNEFLSCLNVIEFYLVNRKIGNQNIKEITRFIPCIYSEIIKLNHEHNLDKKLYWYLFLREKTREFSYGTLDINEFKNSFVKYNIYSNDNNNFCKALLLRITYHLFNPNSINHLIDKDLTIEHIFPQSKKTDNDNEFLEHYNLIGNLSLCSGQQNSKYKNFDFKTKKELYKNDFFPLSRSVYEKNNIWTTNDIQKRTYEMLNYVLEIWNFNNKIDINDNSELPKENEFFIEAIENNMPYLVRIDINPSKIAKVLKNCFVYGYSTEQNETDVFDVKYDGWISWSLVHSITGKNYKLNKKIMSEIEFEKFILKYQNLINSLSVYINERK